MNIEIEKIEIQEYKDCKNIDRLKELISKVRFFQKINIIFPLVLNLKTYNNPPLSLLYEISCEA